MGTGIVQAAFTSGELAPSLYGRIDFARYYTGLKTCRNFIVRPFGGVSNRPGTKYICEVKDSTKVVRLIPFEFNTEQAYVLEFGDQYMRVIKDGGQVVTGLGVVFETSTIYHDVDLALLKTVQSADVMTICHPDYPIMQLSRTDHHVWTFAPFVNVLGPFKDINVDTTKTVYASAVTGDSVTITSTADIFTAEMEGQLLYLEQSPDALTKKWEVQKVMVANDIRRAGQHYYQVSEVGTTGTVRPDHEEGIGYDGDPGVAWQYLHSGFGVLRIDHFMTAKVVVGKVMKRLPDQIMTGSFTKTITHIVPGDPGIPDGEGGPGTPATDAVITVTNHGYTSGNTVTPSGVTGTVGLNATFTIAVIDLNTFSVPNYDNTPWTGGGVCTKNSTARPTYKWAFGAWGGTEQYPGTAAYFNQRQCFAGSYGQPQTLWMSQVGGFTSFATSIPLLDDDAITYSLNSRKANQIRHFVELAELILLTSDGPFMVLSLPANSQPSGKGQADLLTLHR